MLFGIEFADFLGLIFDWTRKMIFAIDFAWRQ